MKKLLVLTLSSVLLAVSSIVAYASIPAPDGTITACYKPSDGKLFVIDSNSTCPSGTTSLTWNQTGPQGPTGATGPQGPAGVSGKNFHTPSQVDIVPGQWNVIGGGPTFTETFSSSETVRISFTTEGAGHIDWYRLLVDGIAIPGTNQTALRFNSSGPVDGTILYVIQNIGVDSWEYAVNLGSGTHSFEIDVWTDTPERFFGPTSMSVEVLGG